MSNIVIEYRILLSNSEFRMSQRFRVDRDIFENGPRVDADLLYTDKKRYVFKKIRIRVDGALRSRYISLASKSCNDFFVIHRQISCCQSVLASCER